MLTEGFGLILSLFDWCAAGLSALWILFVPGLPIAVFLTRGSVPKIGALAISPILSMFANWLFLALVGSVGWSVDFRLYGVLVTAGCVAALWFLRSDLMQWRELVRTAILCLGVGITAFSLWIYAYRGYPFAAPNTDALRHTFWVRRMIDGNSVLFTDFFTENPLQRFSNAGGEGFFQLAHSASYPPAWHTSLAVADSMFHAPVMMSALVSMVIFWSVGLTLGMLALTRAWGNRVPFLGGAAALVAQTMPIVPGVPIAWGSLTSVIGISLLPGSVAYVVFASRSGRVLSWIGVIVVLIGLMLIHTPEGVTVLLVGGCTAGVDLIIRRRWILGATVFAVTLVTFIGLYEGLRAVMPGTFAALVEYKDRLLPEMAFDRFLTMSLNTGTYEPLVHNSWFMWVALVGVLCAVIFREKPLLLVSLAILGLVFVVSSSSFPALEQFRPYTFAWYASYERTAWVAAPFMAFLVAYPFAVLFGAIMKFRGLWVRFTRVLLIALFAIMILNGVDPTVTQLRRGVADNPSAATAATRVAAGIRSQLHGDDVILTPAWDGTLALYIDEGLPVTNGPWTREGVKSVEYATVLSNPSVVCDDPVIVRQLLSTGATHVVFSERMMVWQGITRSRNDIASIRGWKLMDDVGGLYLLQLDLRNCDV